MLMNRFVLSIEMLDVFIIIIFRWWKFNEVLIWVIVILGNANPSCNHAFSSLRLALILISRTKFLLVGENVITLESDLSSHFVRYVLLCLFMCIIETNGNFIPSLNYFHNLIIIVIFLTSLVLFVWNSPLSIIIILLF